MTTVYMVEEKRGKRKENLAVSNSKMEAESIMAALQQQKPKAVLRVKGVEVKA